MPLPPPAADRLRRREVWAVAALAVAAVAFGGVVLARSAFQAERKTDFGVYARAAYAVRQGADPYAVCDDRGWHYCYPPTLAVLLTPLADPWAWVADRRGYLPFAASVAVWYLFSVGCVGYAAHAFAGAVFPGEPRGSRRWWSARVVPVVVGLAAIGTTLSRGQVNVQVVALVAGMFAAAARGRRFAAGAWLAGAICLKVIPGLLVLFPLVRREWRAGAGLAVGLAVGLGVVPALGMGVRGAVDANRTMLDTVLRPGATGAGDQLRSPELTGGAATDSQSFQAVLHNWRHWSLSRGVRPAQVDGADRLAHWGLCGILLAVTLAAARRAGPGPADQLVFLGCLSVVMVLTTPVSHMHYYAMVLPLVTGLWLKGLGDRPGEVWAAGRTTAVLVGWGVLTTLPLFPYDATTQLREGGLGTAATVGLWAAGVRAMTRPAADTAARVVPFVRPARRAA